MLGTRQGLQEVTHGSPNAVMPRKRESSQDVIPAKAGMDSRFAGMTELLRIPIPMNLTELFDHSLLGRPERNALEYSDAAGTIRSLEFEEVEARANRMAHELAARGLTAGDRLCLHIPNCVEVIDIFLACMRLGVIYVPVNPAYRERELRHVIQDADPSALVAPRDEGGVPMYPSGVPIWRLDDLAARAEQQRSSRVTVDVDGAAAAMIIYTSGTTGTSKGAVLSHNSLAANARNVVSAWHISEDDRYLAVLPLFHVHGLANGIHSWLLSGCLMRLAPRFDHREAAALFREFRPTLFFGVPTIYVRMIDPEVIPDPLASDIGRTIRLFVSGSAPLPAHVLNAFEKKFGHVILERYGMSEALMITTNPYDGERRPGSVGHPFPGVEVRLLSEDGADVTEGEVGEVALKSPHLFTGYWRNQSATDSAFVREFFRTGDVATRSSDGHYTLRGRRGDMIISGGHNVYPREIEELLLEDSRVREAAVAGAPDALRGEVPVAYVVTDAEFDLSELDSFCRKQLAPFKVPRAFMRVASLPRTPMGKVQKHLLPPF